MANAPGVPPADGADAGGATASGNGGRDVITTCGLTPRQQLPSLPGARKLSRNSPSPHRGHHQLPGSFERKRKVASEEDPAPTGISRAPRAGASSPAARSDPNRASCSMDPAEGRASESAVVASAVRFPGKRRCMLTRSYIGLFKLARQEEAADIVAKSAHSPVPTKKKKVKESLFQKLQRLPDGCHPCFDNDHLCSLNKLREFWHKSQGAVFVDDKERITKTILFILSVLPDACQPFLLVTTASCPLWEAEFKHFAPCINVVVYDGEKDVHKLIQNPEFHESGSHTKLHVLIAYPDAILKDIKNVQRVDWEAVIVDYCESSVLKHLKQLNQLQTDFRMVLLSSPLKDNILEYKKILDFLNSELEDNGDHIDAGGLATLRRKFTRHIAYERKAGSSKFLEYWVPAYLSQAQLELYSSILLANSSVLRSQTVTEVGALHDIVMCLRKCCNHPCLVGLQHSPVNTRDVTECMDDRMHESGKLLLLEKMLQEIRNKRLRVIVLFQSDGAVGERMGDILEELLRQRFGPESYERVQSRSAFSVKQEAMNMFNDMIKGRFIFLISSRACQSSINLSSVDTVIIYGSDLNPLNDLKALRKIKIESQLKHVLIFRLYTPFTVEEKVLVLAKQSVIIDSSQDIIPSLSHCLLSWGVSVLFSRFDELQKDTCARKSYERETVFMDELFLEFLTKLSLDGEDSVEVNSVILSKASMSGEFYSRNVTLIGEREGASSLDGDPPIFWLNLLDGKSPCQRYKPIEVPTEATNEARRKRRKTGETAGSSSEFSSDTINNDLFPEINTPSSDDLHLLPETVHSEGVENLSTPKSLHAELKCELSKLIEVLKLPDNVAFLAKQFLEYLLKNHQVVLHPQVILHAFNIALCWRAASLLKYTKLDRRESLAVASYCLNYECDEELTGVFYGKLSILKEKVVHKSGGRSNKIHNDRISPHESSSANLRSDYIFPKRAMDLHCNFTNGTQENPSDTEQMVSVGQELISTPETDRECLLSSEKTPCRTAMKRIELLNTVFSLREKNIIEKQQLEVLELRAHRDNQVMKLKEICRAVVQHIRISEINEETRNDQIKLVIQWFTMLMYAFWSHMSLQLSRLESLQSKTLVEEQLMKEKLKQEVTSGQLDPLLDLSVNLPDSNFVVEEFIHFKQQNGNNHVVNFLASGCDQPLDDRLVDVTLARNPVPSEAFSTCAVRNEPTEAHMRSDGGAASKYADHACNNFHCSSDGIDLQRVSSAIAIPASHGSTNQGSSTGDARSVKHAKRDSITNPSLLPGSETSLVVGINADNDCAVAADPDHLESPPILASPQNLTTLQHPPAEAEPTDTLPALELVPRDLQTEMQGRRDYNDNQNMLPGSVSSPVAGINADNDSTVMANLDQLESLILASPQNLTTLQHPPTEAEPTDRLLASVIAARDDQTEMKTPCLTLDAQHQRVCPDDSSNMNLELDTATEILQEGTTSGHLGDSSIGLKDKNAGTVASDALNSENQSYIAPHNPAVFPDAREGDTHTDQSSMPAQHSTSLPAQQDLAISGHPQVEAEPSINLDMDAARSLQLDIQPSNSMLDADSSQAWHQLETTPALSQGGSTCHQLVDDGMGFDVDSNDTDWSHQAHSESPTFAATQSPVLLAVSLEVGTPANLSSVSSLQSNGMPSMRPPEVAESLDVLSTEAEQNLPTDVQASTSLLGLPLQIMFPDDSSQTDFRPDRATELSEEGETEYLACTARNLATLSSPREDEAENGLASMPAHEIASPHVQHSLATSQHPVNDLLPPTSILSEEAEMAGMLCAAAAQDSQHGMQSSLTTQDVPLERTELSCMPVTQSTTVLQRVEPSLAPDLQPGMQDQPTEAERASTSGTTAAQNLRPDTQPSTSAQHIPPERTNPDESIQIGLQPNMTTGPDGPEQLTQFFAVAPATFNHVVCSSEPLRNELGKLKSFEAVLSKNHEQKKSKLQTEYNQEMEKLIKKYELLLQEEDSKYHQSTAQLNDVYRKISRQQSLSEGFGRIFIRQSPAQERSANAAIWQVLQSSQQAQTTTLPAASSLASRPPVSATFHSPGSYLQPSQVARPSTPVEAIQPQPAIPGNPYSASPLPIGSTPLRNGSYGAVGAQPRGPSPHLQQFRMPAPTAMARGDQRQPGVISPGIASLRQTAPGTLESFASVGALAGVPLPSVVFNAVHQEIPSVSISLAGGFPAASLSPVAGSSPESMTNFAQQLHSTIPVAMANHLAPGLNPGFHHMAGGPPNAAAGMLQAGADQAAPELTLLDVRQQLFQRQWPHAPALSLVQQTVTTGTASNSHSAVVAAHQALVRNPALGGMAGPVSSSAGVWQHRTRAAVGNLYFPGSSGMTNARSASRVGLAVGPAGTAPQGRPEVAEVVCLSDEEEQ